MIYLLDANAWIGHLRQTYPTVTHRLNQHVAADVVLCSVVLGELLYGAEHSGTAHRSTNLALVSGLRQQYRSLPFDDAAAEEYGRIRAYLASKGMLIGPNDLMIASIAIAGSLVLATHNIKEFSRVPGLIIEDWQVP